MATIGATYAIPKIAARTTSITNNVARESSTLTLSGDFGNYTRYPGASSLVFTGASITSDFISSGQCLTSYGSNTISKPDSFTFLRPSSIADEDFSSSATSSFIEYLGLSKCSVLPPLPTDVDDVSQIVFRNSGSIGTGAVKSDSEATTSTNSTLVGVSRTIAGPTSEASAGTSNPTAPSTASPLKPGLRTGVKAAIGVCVPTAAVCFFALAVLGIRRYCRNKTSHQQNHTKTSPEIGQPYLQQKAELEAEEKGKFELHAENS
ncbi:MAG: hypothetical protein Q9225_001197 [Loekoesia sp. 1 TL-2023]